MRFLVAVLALLALALAAAPASATTVRLTKERATERGLVVVKGTAVVRAERGERNRLRVVERGRRKRALIVSDRAGVKAGRGCRQRGPRTVSCPSRLDSLVVNVSLGGRADTARLQALFVDFEVDAGRGADRVRTWNPGAIDGGPGDDVLRGPADTLRGGFGDDVMIAGRGGATFIAERSRDGSDVMRGGPRKRDSDGVDYSRRREGVRVDLAGDRANGARGERDQLVGIENLVGGRGDDMLVGSGGANAIVTGGGTDVAIGGNGSDFLRTADSDSDSGDDPGDRFVGGRGDDSITGGSGPDTIIAGPGSDGVSGEAGDDRLDLRDGRFDDVGCGEGDDTLTLDGYDYFTSRNGACESVQRDAPAGGMLTISGSIGPTEFGASVAAATLGCPGDVPATCEGSARLEVAGRPGQPVAFSIARDETAVVRVPFEDDPGQTVRGDLVVDTNLPGGGVSTLVYRGALTIVPD